jgi:hypothetical protein
VVNFFVNFGYFIVAFLSIGLNEIIEGIDEGCTS